MNPYSEFTCLYTSQKQKKAKTWQDGHIRYFHNNSKIVLYDVKFSTLDSMFHKSATIAAGDDLDMDKHLITIEDLTVAYATNSSARSDCGKAQPPTIRRPPQLPHQSIPFTSGVLPVVSRPAARAQPTYNTTPCTSTAPSSLPLSSNIPNLGGPQAQDQQQQIDNSDGGLSGDNKRIDPKRKKWRPPLPGQNAPALQSFQPRPNEDSNKIGTSAEPNPTTSYPVHLQTRAASAGGSIPSIPLGSKAAPLTDPSPAPKRRKVGLSRPAGSSTVSGQSTVVTSHRPPTTQLEFPNAARCTNFTGRNSGQLLRRSMAVGSRFMSPTQYRDSMTYLIFEHLQIMVIEIAITLWNIKTTAQGAGTMDTLYRSRGIHMHSGSTLRRKGDNAYAGFPIYSDRRIPGSGDTSGISAVVHTTSNQGAVLTVSNKEHHSKYSKDDLWVVSKSPRFDAASTFFARSVFYGPSGNEIELSCLSPKDSSAARDMLENSNEVCAIRLFNAMSEFMMLDNLADGLTRTPLLPILLNYVPPDLVKGSKTAVFKAPSRIPEKTGCIVLTEEDGIDMEAELANATEHYHLNTEQAAVLRNFAQIVVRAPNWNPKSLDTPPVLLVHGVFGAGKSFLIAVLIVFIENIIHKARPLPREERSCRFLVSSMTNVAVDRILTALLDLTYTNFVRVGSLKKVARRVLPYTTQSNTGRAGEDIKELQSILADDSLSMKERQYVKIALKKFQKQENRGTVASANVVGTTCVASMFEVLDGASFPIVILDEASQLLEPMSLIPLCRAAGEKLVLVGDPLQLSPPLSTNGENSPTGKGLSRTLFDRAIEMGLKPTMLRTQYRCHRRIADISNALFYSGCLKTGASIDARAPLIEGLPTLTFIDNTGQEIQNSRTKSFTNPAEVRLVVSIIQRLLHLNIPEADIGVISLYKSQADGIQAELAELSKTTGQSIGVQVSTVDAFQGSERDVIIVSTVRTDSIGFIENRQRVNVALTRSKRHLFITGNAQLLNSSSIWGPVIKDHCAGPSDGCMHGNQFLQRLKTLNSLPKHIEKAQLEESDEDDLQDDVEEDEEEEKEEAEYEYTGHEEEADTTSYAVPSPRLGSRKYTFYEADEDDSANSQDEEEDGRWNKKQVQYGSANDRARLAQSLAARDMTQSYQPIASKSLARNATEDSVLPLRPVVNGQGNNGALPSHKNDQLKLRPLVQERQPSGTKVVLNGLKLVKSECLWGMNQAEELMTDEMICETSVEDGDYETVENTREEQNVDSRVVEQPELVEMALDEPIEPLAQYESQRVEDLDVGDWSQWMPKETAEVPIDRPAVCPAKRVIDRDSDDDDHYDDIACLEVGDLDSI